MMQVLIACDDFGHKIAIGIQDGSGKPKPLCCPKERDGILNCMEKDIVANLNKLPKLWCEMSTEDDTLA